jgi:hypothetical protein
MRLPLFRNTRRLNRFPLFQIFQIFQKNEAPMPANNQLPIQPSSLSSQYANFSWWSWRPGLKPQRALALGGSLALIGLLLSCIGIFLLFFSVWDHFSPLQKVSATVQLHHPGHPPSLSLSISDPTVPTLHELLVPQNAYDELKDGSPLEILYTQHLQVPLSLESMGKHYSLSETSSLENPDNSLFLLLPGLLLLCYPALLARWAWHDLFIERFLPSDICTLHAEVVGKRTLTTHMHNRRTRIGLVRGQGWNGVALQPMGKQHVLTFQVDQERFSSIQEGDRVLIRYSPHLHYVYSLTPEKSETF